MFIVNTLNQLVWFLSVSSYEVIIGCERTLRDDLVTWLGLLIIISPSSSSLLFLARRFKTWTIIGAVCSLIDTDADFPQAGWTGSNATICCGIGWFGGKLSKYWRCLIYFMASLKLKRKWFCSWNKNISNIEVLFYVDASLEICNVP